MHRYQSRLLVPLAVAVMAAALLNGAGPIGAGPTVEMALYGVALAAASYLLWGVSNIVRVRAGLRYAVAALVLAAILPEYATEVFFAWRGGTEDELARSPLILATVTGSSRLLIGLAWPLVAVLHVRRSGGVRLALDRDQRSSLLLLLVAALYALTIYLKAFLSLLDTLLLALLFGAYLWRIARPQTADGSPEPGVETSAPPRRALAVGGMAGVAIASVAIATYFADSVAAAMPFGLGRFESVQWLAPLASKTPVLAVMAALAIRGRTNLATSALLAVQIGQLTVLLASLPLAFYLGGLTQGHPGTIILDDRQGSELLLTSAQTLLLVVVLARLSISWRGALALFSLFVLQAAAELLRSGSQDTNVDDMLSAVYLGAAVLTIARDRPRLNALMATLPTRRRKSDSSRAESSE